MADPWNYAGPVAQLGSGPGRSPSSTSRPSPSAASAGDIVPGAAQGLFFRDTRILSRFEVLVNGVRAEPLAAVTDDPFSRHVRVPEPARRPAGPTRP